MTGLDSILDTIRQDAEQNVNSIIHEAKKNAAEIVRNAQVEAKNRTDNFIAESEKDAKELILRAESEAKMQKRTRLLAEKQALIKSTITIAKDSLNTLPDSEYFDVLINLASHYALPEKGEMILNEHDLARLPSDFEEKLAKSLPANAVLSIRKNPSDKKDGGFLLSYGGIEENCLFSALFESQYENLQDKAHAILFRSES